MDITRLWTILRKHRPLATAVGLSCLALFLLMSRFSAGQYRSTARLIVNPYPTVTDTKAVATDPDWRTDYQAMKAFMESDLFLSRIVPKAGGKVDSTDDLRSMLSFTQLSGVVGETNIIELDVTAPDAATAHDVATLYTREFVDFVPTFSAAAYTKKVEFLGGMVSAAEARLKDAESQEAAWQQHNQVLSIQSASATYVSTFSALQQRMVLARHALESDEVAVKTLQSYLAAANPDGQPPWEMVDNRAAHIGQLQAQVISEKQKLASLLSSYPAGEPAVTRQQDVVRRTVALFEKEKRDYANRLIMERQARIDDDRGKLQAAQTSMRSLKKTWSLASNNLQLTQFNRDVSSLHDALDALNLQYQAAVISEQNARREGSIQILDPATEPYEVPSVLSRHLRQSLPILIPISFLLAVAAAYAAESLSSGLSVSGRISQQMDLPLVGAIPKAPAMAVQRWEALRREVPVNAALSSEKPSEQLIDS